MNAETIDAITARITSDAPLLSPQPIDLNAHVWERHPDDWYIEPEWASERLFATEHFEGEIVDPSCGSGRIVRAAREYRRANEGSSITKVVGYDLVSRGKECASEEDFLLTEYATDNIVSNPPFGICGKANKNSQHADNFAYVKQALITAEKKVALLLPLPWLTGADKAKYLRTTPLAKVLILTPRPSMPPGPVIEAGLNPGGGTEDFCWCIWDHAHKGAPTLGWLNRDG